MTARCGRSRRRGAIAFGTVLALNGCILVEPLDYLGNGTGAVAPDARFEDGAVVDDSGGPDVGDGAPGSDAAPGGTWCSRLQPPPFFCADFDEAQLTAVYQGGELRSVGAPFVCAGCDASVDPIGLSPPGAFVASVPPVSDGGAGTFAVRYEQPVTAAATGESLRFGMRILELAGGAEVDVVQLRMPSGGAALVRAWLQLTPARQAIATIDNGSSTNASPALGLPVDGDWHTYELDLDLVPSLHARLTIDDLAPGAEVTHTASFASSPRASFYLGPTVYPPSSAVRVAFDDVMLTVR